MPNRTPGQKGRSGGPRFGLDATQDVLDQLDAFAQEHGIDFEQTTEDKHTEDGLQRFFGIETGNDGHMPMRRVVISVSVAGETMQRIDEVAQRLRLPRGKVVDRMCELFVRMLKQMQDKERGENVAHSRRSHAR